MRTYNFDLTIAVLQVRRKRMNCGETTHGFFIKTNDPAHDARCLSRVCGQVSEPPTKTPTLPLIDFVYVPQCQFCTERNNIRDIRSGKTKRDGGDDYTFRKLLQILVLTCEKRCRGI